MSPLIGLYSAFIIGLITAIFGGRPGMISGATGAIAVVVVALVATHGVEYVFAAVVLMGMIQLVIGLLRLGKFIRLVPHAVMFGFVNGLAVVIFMSQLEQFKITGAGGGAEWMSGTPLMIMLGAVLATMAIIHFPPKLTKAVPSSLVAILFVSLLVIFFKIPTKTVGDIASIGGGLPEFHLPAVARVTCESFHAFALRPLFVAKPRIVQHVVRDPRETFLSDQTDLEFAHWNAGMRAIEVSVHSGTGLEFQNVLLLVESPNASESDVQIAHQMARAGV